MSQENEANEATHAPNVADEFSELCDAMRDKYGMPEGDWKALLDKGMALYGRIPEGAIGEEDVQLATNTNALTAVDEVRDALERMFGELEEELRDAVPKEVVDAGSEEEKLAIAADVGRITMGVARQIAQHRIDNLLVRIGSQGNHGAGVHHFVEAATARLAAEPGGLESSYLRIAQLLVSPEAAARREAEGAVFPTPVDPNGYETIEMAQVANLVSHGMPFEEALAVVQRVGEQ